MSVHLKHEPGAFGNLNNRPLDLFTLSNSNGVSVKITNYGATVTSIHTPDKLGELDDSIVLGFDNLGDYQTHSRYFGCVIGRFCNRIAHGKFSIDHVQYTLANNNNGLHHLHGGIVGFDKKIWDVVDQTCQPEEKVSIKLQYISPDGEEGYPGTLKTQVTYTLNKENELHIDYVAETDKTTIINLTNHSYFNLTAKPRNETILNHVVTINADHYTEVDSELIPTGNIKPVKNTSLDFTYPHRIGERIENVKPGYDHNYILNKTGNKTLDLAAICYDPLSGRTLECYTTQPGLQFYTGNFLHKNMNVFAKYHGFCLETQHFPDSPNHSSFPSTILKPGEQFKEKTVFKFGVRAD
jgi:aldose 1-epimerase